MAALGMALLQAEGADLSMHLRGVADGALFMAQSELALGAVAATVLVVAAGSARRAAIGSILFVLAAACSAWMPQALQGGALVPGVLLAFGVLLASGLRLRGGTAWLALAVSGIATGLAGGLQIATWEETIGGLLVLLVMVLGGLCLGVGIAVPPRLQRGAVTARRTAGAWIAAVGVLLLALWVRRGA